MQYKCLIFSYSNNNNNNTFYLVAPFRTLKDTLQRYNNNQTDKTARHYRDTFRETHVMD